MFFSIYKEIHIFLYLIKKKGKKYAPGLTDWGVYHFWSGHLSPFLTILMLYFCINFINTFASYNAPLSYLICVYLWASTIWNHQDTLWPWLWHWPCDLDLGTVAHDDSSQGCGVLQTFLHELEPSDSKLMSIII